MESLKAVRVASWVIAAVLLLLVIELRLVAAFFGGLIVFELVHVIAPRLPLTKGRTGRAWARSAIPGEVINSLEGPQTASEGDWVIRGPKGEEWATTGDHFAASYQISEPSSLRNS